MTVGENILASIAPAWNSIHAGLWTIQSGPRAGETFTGDVQSEPVVDVDAPLGPDVREQVSLYCYRPIHPGLNADVVVRGRGADWRIGNMEDNPINPRVKFSLNKIEPGKDS